MTNHDDTGDRLSNLLQLAEPRPVPSSDRFNQARAVAREAWQDELRQDKRRRTKRTIAITLATAAVLALAIASYRPATRPARADLVATLEAGMLRGRDTDLKPGARLQRGAIVQTTPETRAAIRLDSGVEVRLDVDTAVSFDGTAIVALDSGAIFVNTGATHRSIEVRSAAGVTRDIGTRFEVRVLRDTTRVRVRDGVVQFDVRGVSHTAQAGVEIVANAASVARHPVGIVGSDWNWISLAGPPFDANGKTLAAFLAWASQEGGWQIEFADEALRRSASTIVIRGTIAGLTPEQAVETIIPTCGLTHRIAGDVLHIDREGKQ
jgi:ferric-dicitrate binding protein FerR (iron transport regulator)